MSLPKEPRQKMINIMYLVLTALLALNVSSEILNAFKTIDQSLTNANGIIQRKNDDILKSLQKKLADPKTAEKAAIWAPKADKAHAIADALYTYVESLKHELKVESRLKNENGKEVFNEDDLEASTRLFTKPDASGKSKGQDLLSRLTQFKKDLGDIDPSIAKEILPNLPLDLSIPTSNSKNINQDWAYSYFHMTPTIASITILTKFQNDIRNSESQVVEYCHRQIGEVELIYDQFNAFAATNSQYLMSGEELIITAGVGAFSSAAKPTISIDGAVVPITADGSATYKTTATTPGENSKRVRISFLKPSGETAVVEKIVKYTVGTPTGLVVSTDKTRVFYKGLDNPLSITGGSGAEKVNATVEGNTATIKKAGPGQYIVNCTQLGSVTINVNDGKQSQKITIPVKRVPDPLAIVGGSAGGNMAANVFRVQKGVIADLRDFVFDGVKFNVTSFIVIATGKGFDEPEFAEVTGNAFSGGASALLRRCQAGSTVTIGEIKVSEPGGGTRKLDQTITFILQ
ncbi:MAG: gliding motility protein GldM [Chitinophagia bacterium]|jgi:gliding motility-associated protein GldM|nr:gliding motility protein GldM [Chitinophagia bacterium]